MGKLKIDSFIVPILNYNALNYLKIKYIVILYRYEKIKTES